MILVNVTGTRPGQVKFTNERSERQDLLVRAFEVSRKWGNKPSQARFTETERRDDEIICALVQR